MKSEKFGVSSLIYVVLILILAVAVMLIIYGTGGMQEQPLRDHAHVVVTVPYEQMIVEIQESKDFQDLSQLRLLIEKGDYSLREQMNLKNYYKQQQILLYHSYEGK